MKVKLKGGIVQLTYLKHFGQTHWNLGVSFHQISAPYHIWCRVCVFSVISKGLSDMDYTDSMKTPSRSWETWVEYWCTIQTERKIRVYYSFKIGCWSCSWAKNTFATLSILRGCQPFSLEHRHLWLASSFCMGHTAVAMFIYVVFSFPAYPQGIGKILSYILQSTTEIGEMQSFVQYWSLDLCCRSHY